MSDFATRRITADEIVNNPQWFAANNRIAISMPFLNGDGEPNIWLPAIIEMVETGVGFEIKIDHDDRRGHEADSVSIPERIEYDPKVRENLSELIELDDNLIYSSYRLKTKTNPIEDLRTNYQDDSSVELISIENGNTCLVVTKHEMCTAS